MVKGGLLLKERARCAMALTLRWVILHVPFLIIRHLYIMLLSLRVLLYCNVGCCVKDSAVHCSRQQWLVAEWLGFSVTVRVRARAREWDSSVLFFSLCVKM